MEPCVLVASACESLPSDVIIKGILGREVLPEPGNFMDGVRSYPWHINTKYYNADVHVCALDKKTIGCQAFADAVNAVVICFDSTSETKLETVEQWLAFTKELEPQIKILVCDHCQEDSPVKSTEKKVGVSKLEAQSWCIQNGFELVELNPEESDADSDVDDDFPESVGMPRVIQALHAHLWPNLTLKGAAERQILPPHAGLQEIANGFTPVGKITSDTRAVDFDKVASCKEEGKKKIEKEIRVATVKPMPKSEPSSDQTSRESSSVSNSAGNNNSQPSSQIEAPREEQLPSLATSTKVAHPATPSSSVTSSAAAHCEASAVAISSSTLSSTREVGIVPPLEIPDDSSKEADEAEASSKSQRPASHPPAPHRDDRIDSMLEALDSMSQDNFEQLFQNLSIMKSKAANLSPTERKAYAEKMAVAFWRSIGGDETEIGDLSSDED